MSRRPAAGADRAAQNQQTLKSLVKLEGNKSCADCKRNKHPRWASWNLGIFVCIRCSGIHRGMGTHISRVKSVDLDAWTDEQLQSMLRWGNTRANKYWEAKLAPGHVPAEAKIENFIRTKYDSRRWVMDGPMPDPSTLDAGDDDAPLNVVQEKAKLDRASSLRNGSTSSQPVSRRTENIDLFGDEPSQPPRPVTTEPAVSARPPPVKAPAAPPKQNKPGESLLGLDFFGGTQSAPPARPSSAASVGTPGVPGRSDLKQSILSLYASAPKQAAAPAQTTSQQFAGMTSPPIQSPTNVPMQASGGLDDAFSSLSFSSSAAPQQPTTKPAPFSNLASPSVPTRQPSVISPSMPSGGSFFDSKPSPAAGRMTSPAPPKPPLQSMSSGFGDFGDFASAAPTPTATKSPPPPASSMGDLFSMSGPGPVSTPAASAPKPAPKPVEVSRQPPPISASSYAQSSAFNLTSPQPATQPTKPTSPQPGNFSAMSNMDAWGSNDAWGAPDPAPAASSKPAPPQASVATPSFKAPATSSMSDDFGGWGSNTAPASTSQPTVAQDDDFGGWSSASPVATTTNNTTTMAQPAPNTNNTQQKSFGGGDDLFANVWE